MNVRSPLVSVLLPVRNGLPWLGQAVASICTQTFRDLELIIIEDGSTDGTAALLGEIRDDRVRIIPTGGVGIARALNIGLEAARGPYIARQDADDESYPTRLARQISLLEERTDIDVAATVCEYVDRSGQPLDSEWVRTVRVQQDVAVTPEAIAHLMPLTCCIAHGSVMARTHVVRSAGGYRHDLVPAEDYDLWLRLLPRHRFAKIPEPLYRYRVSELPIDSPARERQTRKAILAKLDHVRRLYPSLPRPARLAVLGAMRGDELYRAEAVRGGFCMVPTQASWDVLAITDLGRVGEYARRLRLRDHASFEGVGNVFVRMAAQQERKTA